MESITKPVIGIVFCGFSDDRLFVPFFLYSGQLKKVMEFLSLFLIFLTRTHSPAT